MAKGIFNGISVKGIACAVPNNKRGIKDWYGQFGKESVEKFKKMAGVNSIYRSYEKQTASDLAFVAAKSILRYKNINNKSIGALIFISQGSDYRMPATAFVLQHRLDLSKDCLCFDVNLGCSGYVYGVNIVASLMMQSNIERALLLVGDTSTKGVSTEDKSAAMLFGDSGAATLFEKNKNKEGEILYHFRSDGNRFKALIKPAGAYRNLNAPKERFLWDDGNIRSYYETYMNGTEIFIFSITEVPKLIKDFFSDNNKVVADYDSFVFHQANLYILRQIAKKLKIPTEKIAISMDRYGNTSVTSIPLTLSDKYGDVKESGMKNIFICGFGVGLSWGVVTLKINPNDILPIIETDDFFKEGDMDNV
ncbi:MAG: ketoacyl-ACP synthase III [Bacteroidales bacterium]|jgi:3-oxoacyl-[acyl-carrier-protein] synthase-3|nr:ketoacyl-ACP synthase III [Bacteroidales bacterium]